MRRAVRGALMFGAALGLGAGGGLLAARGTVRRQRTRFDPEASVDLGTLPPEDLGPIPSFDGTRLAVRAAGPVGAPTLVFTHGITLDMTTWHYQWTTLADRYRCILFDQRAHGRSEAPPSGDYSLSAIGRDLRSVLDRTAPRGPVVLLGHSMGGMGILSFADQYPGEFGDRVVGAVLVDTAASDLLREGLGVLGHRFERYIRPLTNRAIFERPERAELIRSSMHRWGKDLAFVIAKTTNFGPEASTSHIEYLTQLSTGAPVEVWTQMLRGLFEMDLREALAAMAVPSLVIVGDRDSLTPKRSAAAMRGALPDARTYVITKAGHVSMMERHAVFNRLLGGYLDELFAPARAAG